MSAAPETCDLLVIGLGPAGASAAAAAARARARVVAIDRRREIGVPVQCAEFVPLPMGKYALDSEVFRQHVVGMRTVLPSGERVASDFPGIMIDRAKFDQALAREAAAAGAVLSLGTSLVALDPAASLATVQSGGMERAIRFRALVAADGPHSRVGQLLGLPALETVDTRQYTVPLLEPHAYTDVWLSREYPGGYAWLFPKAGVANLGLGIDTRFAPDLKAPLEALHAQLAAAGLIGREVLARTGGAIPVGGLRERLVIGNILFAGDAAGLTHPVTGAGIAAAVISGEAAGGSVARHLAGFADALATYEEDVRDQFETTIRRAVERRRWMLGYWNRPESRADALHRRGWIAFPEYFGEAGSELATA
ncbi:MAG: geranylgeranyl reductase family protein [Burkholderiales bacterium]|nr:geranylgeranyl reductase family protein [Burkholderiales bacterium]